MTLSHTTRGLWRMYLMEILVKFIIMSNRKIAKGICKHDRMLAKVKEWHIIDMQ